MNQVDLYSGSELIQREAPPELSIDKITEKLIEDVQQYAPKRLRAFVVAARQPGRPWPVEFQPALRRARRLYDAGTHIMTQGLTDDRVVIQYLIPRKTPSKHSGAYFSSAESQP
jgi:hypothetical protein